MLKAGRALPKHDWGLMQGRVWQCWLLTVGWCNICGSVLGMQAQHELHLSFYLIIHMYSFKHSHSSKVICYKMLLLCSHPELRFLSLTPVLLTHNGWDVLVSIQMSNMLQGMYSPELSFCTSGTKQPPLDFLLIGIKLLFSITPPAQYGLMGLCPWFGHSAALLCLLWRMDFAFCDHGHTLQNSLSDWGSQINGFQTESTDISWSCSRGNNV